MADPRCIIVYNSVVKRAVINEDEFHDVSTFRPFISASFGRFFFFFFFCCFFFFFFFHFFQHCVSINVTKLWLAPAVNYDRLLRRLLLFRFIRSNVLFADGFITRWGIHLKIYNQVPDLFNTIQTTSTQSADAICSIRFKPVTDISLQWQNGPGNFWNFNRNRHKFQSVSQESWSIVENGKFKLVKTEDADDKMAETTFL